ncbi:type VI secretion system baseplate subunit TssE [Ramlibacter sp. AW1]|uniref:Type VI secretion system baseplate subunit TssE n=1 Tax=Ramlibacter aurantiacus TaxID=2801330 RepID=A0A937D6A8_9BURK|nr:type VI secretion system baseplate subunit TssE [Ramlibacter aurantiacus]MBL0419616.1 type VI secretion system baseplate subunit TssE [Ramlibacter aurantiacus]
MNTPRIRDRLQPALLDRLRDDEPGLREEPLERRVLSRAQLREAVLRDLRWLLNATRATDDTEGLSQARRSVLFYGLPAWSGFTASSLEIPQMEEAIRQALLEHEPRMLPHTVQVEALLSDEPMDWHNQLSFRISAQMWAQPVPLELLLQTDLDLETGEFEVRDLAR